MKSPRQAIDHDSARQHPGMMVRAYLDWAGWTQAEAADVIGTSRLSVSQLVNCVRSITPRMAIVLGEAFKDTTAEYWMDLQRDYDLARERERRDAKSG